MDANGLSFTNASSSVNYKVSTRTLAGSENFSKYKMFVADEDSMYTEDKDSVNNFWNGSVLTQLDFSKGLSIILDFSEYPLVVTPVNRAKATEIAFKINTVEFYEEDLLGLLFFHSLWLRLFTKGVVLTLLLTLL